MRASRLRRSISGTTFIGAGLSALAGFISGAYLAFGIVGAAVGNSASILVTHNAAAYVCAGSILAFSVTTLRYSLDDDEIKEGVGTLFGGLLISGGIYDLVNGVYNAFVHPMGFFGQSTGSATAVALLVTGIVFIVLLVFGYVAIAYSRDWIGEGGGASGSPGGVREPGVGPSVGYREAPEWKPSYESHWTPSGFRTAGSEEQAWRDHREFERERDR